MRGKVTVDGEEREVTVARRNLSDVDREQITKIAPHWVASMEDEEVRESPTLVLSHEGSVSGCSTGSRGRSKGNRIRWTASRRGSPQSEVWTISDGSQGKEGKGNHWTGEKENLENRWEYPL